MARLPTIYKATLTMGEQVYEGKGKTAYDALSSLPTDYTQIKLKGTISLSLGKKKSERFLHLRPLRMFMANKMRKMVLAKDLQFLLR